MTIATHRMRMLSAVLAVSIGVFASACGSSGSGVSTDESTTTASTSSTTTSPFTKTDTTPPATTQQNTATSTAGTDNPVHGDAVDAPSSSWKATPEAFTQRPRTRVRFTCPPNGTLSTIWGTGTYAAKSPVCVAAVHAGLMDVDAGGTVIIQMAGPQDSFTGSTAHGVTSVNAPSASGSYVFPAQ